jgi:hypothetical protein
MQQFVRTITIAGLAGSLAAPCLAHERGDISPTVAQSPTNEPLDLNTQFDLGLFQDEPVVTSSEDAWRVDFNSWMWLMGVEGDIGARGLTADVSADFADVVDASDSIFALSGRLEVGKGRWGGFVDGMYADIGAEDMSGPLGVASIDVTFEEILIDFGIMYRIGEWAPTGNAANNRHNTTLDLYVGGRYTDLSVEVDPELLPSLSRDIDWIDPIVGAKLVLPVAERWHLRINGDVGGFGVESDFTWSVTAVVGYDFTLFDLPATVFGGYRAIGQDFTEGSGPDEFTWDVVQHGPILGFSLKF